MLLTSASFFIAKNTQFSRHLIPGLNLLLSNPLSQKKKKPSSRLLTSDFHILPSAPISNCSLAVFTYTILAALFCLNTSAHTYTHTCIVELIIASPSMHTA